MLIAIKRIKALTAFLFSAVSLTQSRLENKSAGLNRCGDLRWAVAAHSGT